MNKIIASNIINQYPEANSIINELISNSNLLPQNSSLYFGFPKFLGYENDDLEPDLLILSPIHGICIFRFTKRHLTDNNIESIVDEVYSLIFSKLFESKILRKKRGEINLPLEVYLFTQDSESTSEYKVSSIDEIFDKIRSQKSPSQIKNNILNEAKSIIDGTKALATLNLRKIDNSDKSSLAYVVSQLENEIKTFDYEQLQSAITILDGPQRIRGLAGSGKTVVLAMKAAQIHINEPEKVILFTFYTKSLYQQIKDLITKFYRHYKKTDPNWNNIHIKHAWGGYGIDGVYHSTCLENGIEPLSFREAKKNSMLPFDYVCKKAINSNRIRPKYDFVLIDEAQDLTSSFFRLIYLITKFNENIENEKNIIWGYDDLQNIFNVRTKTPKELFGTGIDGLDLVDLDRASSKIPEYVNNDIVLHKCYRNPRSVLLVAFSLGFGFYNQDKSLPVQILENKEHWEDLGYVVTSGDISEKENVEICRPEKNSPLTINKYIDHKKLIKTVSTQEFSDEIEWIIQEIIFFKNEGMEADDIIIISLDDRFAKTYFKSLTAGLNNRNILVNNLLLNPYTSTTFKNKNHITLSTVHRAKGNEAPIVFVVGIDAIYSQRNSRAGRNKIFTAFTRTKCCLRVSGIGEQAQYFINEINATLLDYPKLKFIQPPVNEVETIQRDLNDKVKKVENIKKELYEKFKKAGLSNEEIAEVYTDINKNKI